jgi:hypothetical protein
LNVRGVFAKMTKLQRGLVKFPKKKNNKITKTKFVGSYKCSCPSIKSKKEKGL